MQCKAILLSRQLPTLQKKLLLPSPFSLTLCVSAAGSSKTLAPTYQIIWRPK